MENKVDALESIKGGKGRRRVLEIQSLTELEDPTLHGFKRARTRDDLLNLNFLLGDTAFFSRMVSYNFLVQ